MTRKSPVRHRVKAHTRKRGRIKVRSYERGKGKPVVRKVQITKYRTVKGYRHAPKPFTVNFKYSNRKGDGESVVVIATSYNKALDEAFEERVDKRQPIEIDIIDPDFGRVFRAIGSGLKTATKIGAKYAVKGGHIAKQATIRATPYAKRAAKLGWRGVRFTGKSVAEKLAKARHSRKLKKLIRKSYSSDLTERALARHKLKSQYPDIYDICDFSRT